MRKTVRLSSLVALLFFARMLNVAAQAPNPPTVVPAVVPCGSTSFSITATPPNSSQQVKWYSDYYMQNLLYTGNTYTGTATQSQVVYAATYDAVEGQSQFPTTAYIFVPQPPVVTAVAGIDPVTNCLGAITTIVDTTYDSVSTVDIGDTYVMMSSPNTNYGTLNNMTIWSGLYHSSDSARLYMKFDLSQIPSNVFVSDSRLTMTCTDGFAHGNNGNIYEHFVSDDTWTETGLTWNNKPAATFFNIGWTGNNMGLPTANYDSIQYMYWQWYDDYGFDGSGVTNYGVHTVTNGVNNNVFSGLSPLGQTDSGILADTRSQYAGDKILSFILESPGYDTRWRTKEYTSDETTIPHLKVYFGYNSINSTFAWTGPNGYTSTEQSPTGLLQGVYTLTITNPFGCTATTQVSVTNGSISEPSVPVSICYGSSYTFYGQTYNTNGTYYDTLTASTGCDSIVSITLTVSPPLQQDLYDSICIGGSYTYAGNGMTYTQAGDYIDTFITSGGCDSVVTLHLAVRPAGPAPVVSPISYCQDSVTNQLTLPGGTPPIYWYTDATSTPALATAPTPSSTIPGDYNWYVSETDQYGCETQRADLTVHVYPTTEVPTFVSPTYCKYADAVPLQADGTDLMWYTQAQGGVGTDIAPTPSTQEGGTEYFYVTQTLNSCASPRAPIEVTITPPPAPPTPIIYVYCQNEVPANIEINGQNLTWYLTDSGGTGTSTFPTDVSNQISVKTPFYVSQTVNGCESDRSTVYVEPCCLIEVPSAFTPNGDSHNDYFHIISNGEYRVYRMSIYNRWGQEIYEASGSNVQWDGTVNSKPADIGDYYYYIVYTCGASGFLTKKGDVTLIR